jgi:ABC-type multidrug transport system fused ATPase/permease subunit
MKNKNKKLTYASLKLVFGSVYDLIKQYRKYFFVAFGVVVVVEVLNLVGNYIIKEIVDSLIALDEVEVSFIVWLVIGWSGVYFFMSILQYINTLWVVKVEIKIAHYLRILVYQKLMGLSLGYHEKENTGAKLTKIDNGVESVRRIVDRMFWDFFPTIIKVVLSFGFLMFIDWRIGLTFIVIVPIFVGMTFRMNSEVYPVRKKIRKGFEKVYGKFGQAIYNVKTVQAYVQEDRELKEAKRGVWAIIRNQFKFIKTLFSYNFWRFNVVGVGGMAVMLLGVYLAHTGQISTGELVLFLNISMSAYFQLYALSRIFDDVMEAKVGVERILKIIDSEESIPEKEDAVKLDIKGEIEFKNVHFDYGEEKVLKNINLKINAGDVVAFVGPSGGGKTTMVKLLYRYFDVKRGSIFIDGYDLRDISLDKYRSQLGIVSQDIDIFNTSIKNNIAYGQPRRKIKDIKGAAKIANADEFINRFDKKFETEVGERGIKLSGGQKQRIGIARAILVDPAIMVLDEATSSLDAESEKMIQSAINRVIKKRTTIIIAHRLSTIKHADKIVVIDKGRIIEAGTHKELIRKKGAYSRLVKLQISGYLS